MRNNKIPEIPSYIQFNGLTTQIFTYIANKLKDPHLKELLEGGSIAFVFKVLGMAIGYIFTLLITRNLGADAMGIFALSYTVLSMVSLVGRLGMDIALIRFVAEYSAQGRRDLLKEVYITTLKIVVPCCVLLSILLFYFSPYIAKNFFHKEHLEIYFRIVSFAVLPVVLIFINAESLRGLKKIKEYSFLVNISPLLFAMIILAVTFPFRKEIYVPVISYVISAFIASVLSVFLWFRKSELTRILHKKSLKLKTVLNVSLPMLLTSSLYFLMQWIDTLMIGVFRTEAEVGVYNVAFRIAAVTGVTLFAIERVTAPKFAEFYSLRDMKGLKRLIRQSTKLTFWTSLPVMIVFFLFPSLILGIFGEEFKTGVYALVLLTLVNFICAVSGSVGYILQMTGKQYVFQYIVLLALIINIILNIILIPRYGINGAAFASLVTTVFWNACSILYVKYYLNVITAYFPFKKNS